MVSPLLFDSAQSDTNISLCVQSSIVVHCLACLTDWTCASAEHNFDHPDAFDEQMLVDSLRKLMVRSVAFLCPLNAFHVYLIFGAASTAAYSEIDSQQKMHTAMLNEITASDTDLVGSAHAA